MKTEIKNAQISMAIISEMTKGKNIKEAFIEILGQNHLDDLITKLYNDLRK
jgi:hypothetical protein